MPIELDVVLKNGETISYYIPTVLMRGEKEIKATRNQLDDWAWTNPSYAIFLKQNPEEIASVNLHPNSSIADVEALNNNLVMPVKWNWEKHNLSLTIVAKRKKGMVQKLVKIKK